MTGNIFQTYGKGGNMKDIFSNILRENIIYSATKYSCLHLDLCKLAKSKFASFHSKQLGFPEFSSVVALFK